VWVFGKEMKMKKFILALLLGLLPGAAFAQGVDTAYWAINYNISSSSYTYCVEKGLNGNPFGGSISGAAPIKTSGSSTTVVENTSSTNPFALLSVGDVIIVTFADGTSSVRNITAKASAASITVDTAIDLSAGYAFRWYQTVCGTGATNGWLDVGNYADKTYILEYNQGDIDSLDVRWECKYDSPTAAPVVVYPSKNDTCGQGTQTTAQECNFTTAGITSRLAVTDYSPAVACRVGLKYHSTDTSDATTNREQINLTFVGRIRK
jgi:hypothetical protein